METKNRWVWKAVSSPFQLSSLSGFPDPPSIEEVKQRFLEDGQVDTAIGEFVTSMLDEGYTITLLGYEVSIEFECTRTWSHKDHDFAEYKTHTTLAVDFKSDPECLLTESPLVITTGLIVAVGKAIAWILVGVGVYFAFRNLTTTHKEYEKWGYVKNPDTGEYEWKIIEKGSEDKPPVEAWSGIVIIIIALVFIMMLPSLIRRQ